MNIRRAVLTAAHPDQVALPLQTLVDRDGRSRPLLEIQLRELASAGVEAIAVVIAPGHESAYRAAAREYSGSLTFCVQQEPRGYGDALCCAAEFMEGEPFLHAVGDHLYLTHSARSCARQLVDLAREQQCSVSAVQATREHWLSRFGTIGGHLEKHQAGCYRVELVREKPTPTLAEQELIVPGLRAGHYLCYFGMHVVSAPVMDDLLQQRAQRPSGGVSFSAALDRLARRERYLALEVAGRRQDLAPKYGLFFAQWALALQGEDREAVLAELVPMLVEQPAARTP